MNDEIPPVKGWGQLYIQYCEPNPSYCTITMSMCIYERVVLEYQVGGDLVS